MRRRVLRLGAIAFGLALLGILEGVLRLVEGKGPGVEFAEVRPLFERAGEVYRTAEGRTNHFVRVEFPVVKGEEVFRAFVLGGSTVQGRPWAPATAFPAWMEIIMEERFAPRKFEIVNCGGISYASYRLLPILEECLRRYRPDRILLCMGHNEFLERQEFREREASGLSSLRLYRLMMRQGRTEEPRRILPAEVDALLDHRGGLEAYRRDAGWREDVADRFRNNLETMAGMCERAGVPLTLLVPPSNLRSSPPFKSEHRTGITDKELARWERHVGKARKLYGSDATGAVVHLQAAIAIDGEYAHTHFALGTMLENLGRKHEARAAFIRAKEFDVCPLRMLESERRTLLDVARKRGLPVLDLQALLEKDGPSGILGSDMLVDHIHPSIRGHQRIAEAVVGSLGWGPPPDRSRLATLYTRRMESLDALYFARGRLRLDNLNAWTQGRAEGVPLEEPPR